MWWVASENVLENTLKMLTQGLDVWKKHLRVAMLAKRREECCQWSYLALTGPPHYTIWPERSETWSLSTNTHRTCPGMSPVGVLVSMFLGHTKGLHSSEVSDVVDGGGSSRNKEALSQVARLRESRLSWFQTSVKLTMTLLSRQNLLGQVHRWSKPGLSRGTCKHSNQGIKRFGTWKTNEAKVPSREIKPKSIFKWSWTSMWSKGWMRWIGP
jgi:hypothetical protein